MNQRIRVAFIGAGPTTKAHVEAFSDIPKVKLVGIYNRTFEKASLIAQKYKFDNTFVSIEELYRVGKPDLVVISVYETAKLEILSLCLPYQIPILAEKPIGLNYKEAIHISALAKKHQCPLWIGLNRRSYSSTRHAIKLLEGTDFLKRVVEVTDQQDINIAKNLGHSEPVIKNWMYANSIHLIDYFSTFARGNLENIHVNTLFNEHHLLSFVTAYLTFTSGDVGIYKAYWNRPGPWACTISTSDIFIELKPLEKVCFKKPNNKEWNNIDSDFWDKTFKPGFRFQAQQAINAVMSEENLLTDINAALKSTKLIYEIYENQRK